MPELTELLWEKDALMMSGFINSDHQWEQFVQDVSDFVQNWFEGQVTP